MTTKTCPTCGQKLPEIKWIKIGYEQIPKKIFDRYGAKPFEIMEKRMRKPDGSVWNNISWKEAKKEAKKMGYRLPTINEMLVLLDFYKMKYPKNSVCHQSFLGISELSCDEEICFEWVDAPVACSRSGYWGNGNNGGAFTLRLSWDASYRDSCMGFRCAR